MSSSQKTGEQVMTNQDFTTSLLVDQSPQEVFDAINNVRGWWSGELDGSTDRLGAEFKYSYKDMHCTIQKITEFVPGKKVVWHVVESHINFAKDKGEWNGTDIVFEISKKDGKTELRFTHVGLIPAFECYGDCSGAWGFYIKDSLRNLITTGKGQPSKEETGAGKRAS
jgi:activator of Hsp90 ATPase-like protein